MIEKVEKNLYVWRGRSNDDEMENARLDDMHQEKRELQEEEQQLDKYVISRPVIHLLDVSYIFALNLKF